MNNYFDSLGTILPWLTLPLWEQIPNHWWLIDQIANEENQ